MCVWGGGVCACTMYVYSKEYEILGSPGSGASLFKTGKVYNYCVMRGICLLNRAISPTFLPLYPGHSSTTPAKRRVHCVKGERRWNNSRPNIQEDCRVKFQPWPCFRSSRPLPGLLSLIYSLVYSIYQYNAKD